MHIVATAGHVDHGKSTLVLALSGTDPDRWKEEKERGLTIDLGFAHTVLPSGAEMALVDVPGHVRFIRNMLAGVGAVDACLFVVAATEGWKPQSEEHLRILDLLGVSSGVVALTKAGLVDETRLKALRDDITQRLEGTRLAGAQIVEVDSVSGFGIERLRESLDLLLKVIPRAPDEDRPRLWVDRSFAVRGSGTVVTGTLAGGTIAVADTLVVLGAGHGPQGLAARVRAMQTHGLSQASVSPGHRVAVNLVGIGHKEVVRGDALVRSGQWQPSTTFDASLRVLASLSHPVSRRGAYALYAGSGEHAVALRVIGATGEVEPGQEGLVRLHLRSALPLTPGDHYVLREHGRGETVGGGEILDVDPVLPAAKARPSRSVERVVAERGWVDADLLYRLTGRRCLPDVAGRWVVDPDVLAEDRRRLSEKLSRAGKWGLDIALLDDKERALLPSVTDPVGTGASSAGQPAPHSDTSAAQAGGSVAGGSVAGGSVAGGSVAGGSVAGGSADPLAGHPFLAALEKDPWSAPKPASYGTDRLALRAMLQRKLVIERDGIYFSASTVARSAKIVAGLLASSPEGVTVSAVRDALGANRKTVLPLLSYLDSTGVTRRRGDFRVAGPLLPQ